MKYVSRLIIVFSTIVLLLSCSKQAEFTEVDDKFLIVRSDFDNYSDYISLTQRNGKDYYYTNKILKPFGRTAYFSQKLKNPKTNAQFTWRMKSKKAHKVIFIQRLYKKRFLESAIFKDNIVKLDLERYAADGGFCINNPAFFQCVLIKGNTMLDLSIEGFHGMTLEKLDPLLKSHLEKTATLNLE